MAIIQFRLNFIRDKNFKFDLVANLNNIIWNYPAGPNSWLLSAIGCRVAVKRAFVRQVVRNFSFFWLNFIETWNKNPVKFVILVVYVQFL